jgi:hypothetical protein
MATREELIDGLRKAADFYEQHPEVPTPSHAMLDAYYFSDNAKNTLAAAARALGRSTKQFSEHLFYLTAEPWPGIRMDFTTDRENVCRKITVCRLVPAEPERIVPASPEHIEQVVTWECDEPLQARVMASDDPYAQE